MATWIYNNKIVREHPIYQYCASRLNVVSNRDYPDKDFFKDEIECLDMDTYEKNVLKTPHPECTTDAVIGICDYDTMQPKNLRLLCIELRMDYESVNTFSKTDFLRKVTHTKDLLGYEINVEQQSLFVFSDKLEAQARSWFSRHSKEGGNLKYIQSCGISNFTRIIMSEDDFPYHPQHDEQQIRTEFMALYQKDEWMAYMQKFNDLCYEAMKCYSRQYQEYDFLRNLLSDIWSNFRRQKPIFDNYELDFFVLNIESDFEQFLKK